MGAYLMISQKWSIAQVKEALGSAFLASLKPFRDAGIGPDNYPITVIDCLEGLHRAMQLNWYSKSSFDCYEFEQMLA